MIKSTSIVACILLTLLGSVDAGARGNKQRAVTLWWVIFNEPDNCVTSPGSAIQCGAQDIFGQDYLDSIADGTPDPTQIEPNLASVPGVIYASGDITEKNGRVAMAASIYRSPSAASGEALGPLGPGSVDPLGLKTAFVNPQTAEVHLVLRDHGRVIHGAAIEQITNFLEPYCTDPLLLWDMGGDNLCQDVQAAVFAANQSGAANVFELANPDQIRGTAHLLRNGDMIQAVVNTRLHKHRHH